MKRSKLLAACFSVGEQYDAGFDSINSKILINRITMSVSSSFSVYSRGAKLRQASKGEQHKCKFIYAGVHNLPCCSMLVTLLDHPCGLMYAHTDKHAS